MPIAVCFVGVGMVVPVSTAKAMAPFKKVTGVASSLLGFTRMGIAALGTLAMSLAHKGSVYDMPVVFLGLIGIAIAFFAGYLLLRGPPPQRR